MSIVLNGTTGLTITGATTSSTFGGVTTAAVDDGTYSSGNYVPSTAGGNMRFILNNGAFTLVAPSTGSFTMVILVTNGASAGAITLSGFNKTSGSFTTTNGDDFFVYITVCNGFKLANVVPLQ